MGLKRQAQPAFTQAPQGTKLDGSNAFTRVKTHSPPAAHAGIPATIRGAGRAGLAHGCPDQTGPSQNRGQHSHAKPSLRLRPWVCLPYVAGHTKSALPNQFGITKRAQHFNTSSQATTCCTPSSAQQAGQKHPPQETSDTCMRQVGQESVHPQWGYWLQPESNHWQEKPVRAGLG